MTLTRYRETEVQDAIRTAKQRASQVPQQIAAAKQSVLDSRANYLRVKSISLASGMSPEEVTAEYGNDYAADANEIFNASGPHLIALLAEVSRITGTSARSALEALAAAAPDAIPADNQTVQIESNGSVTLTNV
ncbi:hypothetical protein [Roseiconus lacunae]|uniref:hypothetical protein n=1 Tax=Roseiconus lacunae TaxID=2605694 RepID=UPI001E530FEC|nr:hypothetical protein [Roseiconus lacunae]MCD0460048.1 hypothetical protein [Roseiconus lacunae]